MALVDKGGYLVDNSQWKKMRKNLERGSHLAAKIGWFDTYYGPDNNNLSVAQVAQWNNEGMGIPMRRFSDEFKKRIEVKNPDWMTPKILSMIDEIAMGKRTWTSFYNEVGVVLVRVMQEEIEKFSIPMNAPLTIFLKGFNDPLIDSGKMLDSVEYQLGRTSLGG